MSTLILEAKILDPQSAFHKKTTNILIKDGSIAYIGNNKPKADKIINESGLILTPGWLDLQANFCDPGDEHKEDLVTGRSVAMAGGFTEVAVLPNTKPVIQSKNDIEYIKRDNKNSLVQLWPIAAISKNTEGEDFTEILDLEAAGAIAFSDGLHPLWNTDLLRKSLQYVQKFDGLVIDRPQEKWLSQFGVMNEGVNSALLGMKGIPALAEEVAVARNIQILEYAGGMIHLSNLSSSKSVSLVRKAKKKGLKITCDVAIHQLVFTDDSILEFDSNYKVDPPLRGKKDIKALIKGLNDGTIDAIVTAHQPQDEENKKLEFDQAANGMNNMQVILPLLNMLKKEIPLEILISKLTSGPRTILGLENPVIEKGAEANVTLMSLNMKWVFDKKTNASKSINSPLFGEELTGKVVAVFNNGHYRDLNA
ncbi:MAG: dihydroorotase [Bacteroidetes bacterium]|nr:MAG: dihydroorotase [Bacteroidota bacterium]